MADSTDPSLADLITADFVPEIYSKNVQMALERKLVIVPLVDHSFQDELTLGTKIWIPVMDNASAGDVNPGSEIAGTDLANATAKSITVNEWQEAIAEISEMSAIQVNAPYLAKAAIKCANAVAKAMDYTLAEKFKGFQSDDVYGADGQTLSDDIILHCMETLDEADVPEDERSIVIDPSSKVDLLKIDKFVRNDYVREVVIPTGRFGNIYNMGVFITNNLEYTDTGNYAAMFHKDALGFVAQKQPTSVKIPMPWKHKTVINVHAIWGVAELRDTSGICFYTRKL